MHTTRTQTLAKGFTLTELLVVISIIVLLVAIAVPAFSTILYNNERAQAENQLRVGISSARDAAIASDGGDAAAVFIFRPGDRLLIIPAVMVGTIEDQVIVNGAPVGGTTTRTRDVFVPVATGEPIALPRGWSIRGFAPPGAIDAGTGIANGWYDALLSQPTGSETRGNWLFPESGYYDGSRANDGWKRQTFIVRFDSERYGFMHTGQIPSPAGGGLSIGALQKGHAIIGAASLRHLKYLPQRPRVERAWRLRQDFVKCGKTAHYFCDPVFPHADKPGRFRADAADDVGRALGKNRFFHFVVEDQQFVHGDAPEVTGVIAGFAATSLLHLEVAHVLDFQTDPLDLGLCWRVRRNAQRTNPAQ